MRKAFVSIFVLVIVIGLVGGPFLELFADRCDGDCECCKESCNCQDQVCSVHVQPLASLDDVISVIDKFPVEFKNSEYAFLYSDGPIRSIFHPPREIV